MYTVSQKSDDILIFKNNSVKDELILVIFDVQNSEETWYQMYPPRQSSSVKCLVKRR